MTPGIRWGVLIGAPVGLVALNGPRVLVALVPVCVLTLLRRGLASVRVRSFLCRAGIHQLRPTQTGDPYVWKGTHVAMARWSCCFCDGGYSGPMMSHCGRGGEG